MAYSLNRVCLLGNVGADPENRSLTNGGQVVNLRVATSETWKDRDGERQERTQWHQIVVWNEPLGEIIMNHVRKGSKIYIEGQLETRKWTDQSGNDKYTTEVVLRPFNSALIILDPKDSSTRDRGQSDHDYDDGRSSRGTGRGKRADEEGSDGGGFGFGGGSRPQPAAFDTDLDDDVPF